MVGNSLPWSAVVSHVGHNERQTGSKSILEAKLVPSQIWARLETDFGSISDRLETVLRTISEPYGGLWGVKLGLSWFKNRFSGGLGTDLASKIDFGPLWDRFGDELGAILGASWGSSWG